VETHNVGTTRYFQWFSATVLPCSQRVKKWIGGKVWECQTFLLCWGAIREGGNFFGEELGLGWEGNWIVSLSVSSFVFFRNSASNKILAYFYSSLSVIIVSVFVNLSIPICEMYNHESLDTSLVSDPCSTIMISVSHLGCWKLHVDDMCGPIM